MASSLTGRVFHFATPANHGLGQVFGVSRFFGGILLGSFLGINFLDTTNPPLEKLANIFWGVEENRRNPKKNAKIKKTSKNYNQMVDSKNAHFRDANRSSGCNLWRRVF